MRSIPFQPTAEQHAVLEHRGPLLVLAGAGVGKTTVLTERIASLITDDGIPANNILALTFTRAAAQEMRTRIVETLSAQGFDTASTQVVVHTYHGFAGEIVREFGLRFGISPTARPMSKAEQWTVLDEIFDLLHFNTVEFRQPGTAFQTIMKFAANAQAHLITASDISTYVTHLRSTEPAPKAEDLLSKWEDMSRAFSAYQTRKLETGRIDYGDQIVYAVQLLRDTPWIRDSMHRRHPYVFVDEYQDTNLAQQELVLNLHKPQSSRLFVIGDDDQAIFRFQGANVEHIRQLPHDPALAADPLTVKTLVGNRRSLPPILDVANRIVANITDRPEKPLKHLRTGKANVGAYVANTEHDEAAWIADMIHKLKSSEPSVATWGDIAVLCRRHADIDVVHQALTHSDIPCIRARPTPLLARSEIDEVRATLEALVTPMNDIAVARILAAPRWRLAESDLWALARHRDHHRTTQLQSNGTNYMRRASLIDTVIDPSHVADLSQEARSKLETLTTELRMLTEIAQRSSVEETIRAVTTHGQHRDEYAVGFDPNSRESLATINRFEQLSRSFGGRGLNGLRSFLRFLDRADESDDHEINDSGPAAIDANHVMLATIHSAKGLEWPAVFVYGLAKRRSNETKEDDAGRAPYPLRARCSDLPEFPDAAFTTDHAFTSETKSRDLALEDRRLDDERRILYVALTRARDHLYVSRAHWYGSNQYKAKPSPFWEDLIGPDFPILGEESSSTANPSLTHPRPPISVGKAKTTATAEHIEQLLAAGEVDAAVELAMDGTDRPDTWNDLHDRAIAVLHHDFSRPEIHHETNRPEIHTASYTSIKTFHTCPRQYRHLFIDQLPTPPNPAREIGSALHRLLARTGEEGGHIVLHDDNNIRGDLDIVLADKPDLLDRYAKSRWGRRTASHVEVKFSLPIGRYLIRGAIDRVDELPDGTFEIADFKSGKRPPIETLKNDLQLPIYALAVEDTFGVSPDQLKATFCYLGDGQEWSLTWSEDQARSSRIQLTDLLQAMTTSEFPMTEDTSKCRRCDFRHICNR